MIPVVMSGGSGTRLWPYSRSALPKQFCEIFDDTLHRKTLKRLAKFGSPWVITSKALQTLTLSDLRDLNIPVEQGIFEPVGRNTAPAIAALCAVFKDRDLENEVVGIFPADHLVGDEEGFAKAVHAAAAEAATGKIVTIGVRPSFAATAYGYIEVPEAKLNQAVSVKSFHEKPNEERANQFLKDGCFLWNAGIFIFKVKEMISLFEKYQPAMWQLAQNLKLGGDWSQMYSKFENISIDYAIMEKLSSNELSCVPGDFNWSDVGSWEAIADLVPTHKLTCETKGSGNFALSKDEKVYAFCGLSDVMLIDTPDATLVIKKGAGQDLKQLLSQVSELRKKAVETHTFENRPWGRFEVLRDNERFKTKVMQIKPGQQLSYQSHDCREEHWIIVAGEGEVVLNDKVTPVKKGSYIHIPQQAKHRVRNTGSELLQFVEVHLGSYFGEEDIVRYEDDYQRC